MIQIEYERYGRFRWVAMTQRDDKRWVISAPRFTKRAADRNLIFKQLA